MSGFGGIVRFDGAPVSRAHLAPLAAGLEAKAIATPRFWHAGCAGLVHRQRVATPEDRAERQPLAAAGGQAIIAFDGRLDDRAGLARHLARPFDPALPDGAWAAAAFERWDQGAPAHLLGDFAIAWWDERHHRLILARDAVGQRSLYYHAGNRFIAFATTLRALLALPEVPRELDETGLADFIALNPFEAERTLYRDIYRVPPAHLLIVDAGRMRLDRHWQPDPTRRLRLARDEDYVAAARELLDQAVASRLRLSGPIVAMTSGGLDSAGITATAARLAMPATVHGLTAVPSAGFSGPIPAGHYADERPYVAELAGLHSNLTIETLGSDEDEAIEADPNALFAVAAQPLRNVHGIAWLGPLLRRASTLGATAVLGGDFGNMSLSYDGIGRIDELVAERRWIALAQTVRQAARSTGIPAWRLLAGRLLPWRSPRQRIAALFGAGEGRAGWADYSALDAGFAAEIGLDRHFATCGFDPARRNLRGSYAAMLPRMLQGIALSSDARSALRALTGLEFRDPLADTRLLDFCLSIPSDQFLRGGQNRWLARRVLADRLPPAILDNRRRGAQAPEWFARLDRRRDRIAHDIARLETSPLASRVLDMDRLRHLMRTWPNDAAEAQAQTAAYRFLLARGVHAGQFIRWVEGRND